MSERKLPIGIQSFENIRRDHYIYIDKTPYIWNLVQTGKVYFLSRPRRFGKSLLISTMESYFQGRKDLFQNLAMEGLENSRGEDAWTKYPVIRFSLSGGEYNSQDGLYKTLDLILSRYETEYDVDRADYDLPNRFRLLIETAWSRTGKQVVVLVDEYDKPLLETMTVNKEQEEKNRQIYKGFFSVLKDEDQYLKFVFFTGVTKFSKVSIFSDLNQLEDISLSDDFSGICGITQKELADNFQPEIAAMVKKQKTDLQQCIENLARMYDGYHFSPEGVGVYNPFSLLRAFKDKRLRRYWFETGTPDFLIRRLRASAFTAEQFTDGIEADEAGLTDYHADNPDPTPLFYQTGYLTIRDYDDEFQAYTLGFPNDEVKYGFLNSLVPYVLGDTNAERPLSVRNMILDLRKADLSSFFTRLESLFASIPYIEGKTVSYEAEWRNEVFLIFMLMGQHVECEVHSATGRADCVVKTDKYIYIFEFKLDKAAEEALGQIEEKKYAAPYKADPREVIEIGVNFRTDQRNVGEWKIKRV